MPRNNADAKVSHLPKVDSFTGLRKHLEGPASPVYSHSVVGAPASTLAREANNLFRRVMLSVVPCEYMTWAAAMHQTDRFMVQ